MLDNYKKQIGMRFKEFRVKKYGDEHGSKKACAEAFGFSQSQWANYEAGQSGLTLKNATKIAEKIGVSLLWLATGTPPMETKNAPPDNASGAAVTTPYLELFEQTAKTQALVHELFRRVLMGQFEEREFRRILVATDTAIQEALQSLAEGQESM